MRSIPRSMTFLTAFCILLGSGRSIAASPPTPGESGPAAPTRGAADVCLSVQARAEFELCPAGPSASGTSAKPSIWRQSTPMPAPLPKKTAGPLAPGASLSTQAAARDERRTRLAPRVQDLLVREIAQLEALFGVTPRTSPDRASVARRLAEAYVELESAAFRTKTEASATLAAPGATASKGVHVGSLEEQKRRASQLLILARSKAIQTYTLLKNDYPDQAQIDEVLYYLAYEYEQAGDSESARKIYYELIQKAPKSRYIPHAYLAFGELFFSEAMRQSDAAQWDLSAGAYREVLKYPPPENRLAGYAHYKLAYVYWNKGEFGRAIDELKKTVEYGRQFPSLPGAGALVGAARHDLVPVYALAGRPESAYAFFQPLGGETLRLLDELGAHYIDTGHYAEAITVYHDLMVRDRGGEATCRYQAAVAQATMALRSGSKDAIRTELDRQIDVYRTYSSQSHTKEERQHCANITAELVTETAMAWHLEAVGSGGVRGTGDRKTTMLAVHLYRQAVANFTTGDFASFQFPRIVKEDWPTLLRVKYALADLLYSQKLWDEAGAAFDAVVDEAPDSPEARESAYAAALSYQQMFDVEHASSTRETRPRTDLRGSDAASGDAARLKSREWSPAERRMLAALKRYVCHFRPDSRDTAAVNQYVQAKFAIAHLYFEAQRWGEAALAFRELATSYPGHEDALPAAQLYLESLNVMSRLSGANKTACIDRMADDLPALTKTFCEKDVASGNVASGNVASGSAPKNEHECAQFAAIQCDVRRTKAQAKIAIADGGGPNALALYEEAGNDYMRLWRDYGGGPVGEGGRARDRAAPQCEHMDEILYNAAAAYQAGKLLAKAVQARAILVGELKPYARPDLVARATYQIGANYQAMAVYDQSASWYERYVRENPKAADADKALADATLLRLGLGQDAEALRDGSDYARRFGASRPTTSAEVAFAIALHEADAEEWDEVQNRLSFTMSLIDRGAPLDVVLQAHALLGCAHAHRRQHARARAEYARVQALWSEPSSSGKIANLIASGESSGTRRIAKALNAVGEALYFFAEERRGEADAVEFPVYRGPKSRDAILAHIRGPVTSWMTRKRDAIEKAEKAYSKVLDLLPMAPPRWVIAAGAQSGKLWSAFVRDFRAAPIPPDIAHDPELRRLYLAKLDEASEPQKTHAKKAFQTCLSYSVRYQYFDEHSRGCEAWLSKNYRDEYHAVDELHATPNRAGDSSLPAPVDLRGESVHEPLAAPASVVRRTNRDG